MATYGQRWLQKPPRGTLIDLSHSWARGLQCFYSLNESTGSTVNDYAGQQHTGTISGATWAGSTIPGSCLSFSSPSTSALAVAGTPLLSSGTVAAWCYNFQAFGSASRQFIGGVASPHEFDFCQVFSGSLYGGWGAGGRKSVTLSAANWPQNTWTHYAVTWVNGGQTVIYVNGVAIGSNPGTSYTVGQSFVFGNFGVGGGSPYQGLINSAFISGRAMLPSELSLIGSCPGAIWQIMQPVRNFALFGQFPAPAVTTGQQTPILSVSYAPPSTTGTYYAPLCDNQVPGPFTWATSIANVWQPCPVSGGGTLDYLLANCSNSAGGTYQFTVMKSSGGVVSATGLSTTPAANTGSDLTHIATFNQGDLFCMRLVVASGASSAGPVSWQTRFTATGQNQSLVLGGVARQSSYPSNTATGYGSLQGCAGNGSAGNGPLEVQPCGGTYKNLFVYVPTAVATGSWTIAYESGATVAGITTSSLAATVSSGNTGSDTTHSVAATAGQFIGTIMTPASSPTAQVSIMWGVEFDPTINGQSIGTYDITPVAGPLTVYNSLSGSDDDTTGSQTTTQNVIMGGVVVSRLYLANAVPTSSAVVAGTIMRNGAATAITATIAISGSSASDLSDHIVTSDFDLLGVQTAFAGTGSIYPAMGVVFAYASATRVRRTLFGRSGSRGIG